MKDTYQIAIATTSLTAERLAECMNPEETALFESEGLFKLHFFGRATVKDEGAPLFQLVQSKDGVTLGDFLPRLDVVVFPEIWIYRFVLMDKYRGGLELPMCCAISEAVDGPTLEDWLRSITNRDQVKRAAIGALDIRDDASLAAA